MLSLAFIPVFVPFHSMSSLLHTDVALPIFMLISIIRSHLNFSCAPGYVMSLFTGTCTPLSNFNFPFTLHSQ
eukprot:2404933-Karenia_brevis.AAC.1